MNNTKYKILCVGEILWDVFPNGRFLGGAPFNVACHLTMLGEEVNFVSRVGRDELGERAMRQISEKKLSPECIQRDERHATGIVNVTLDRAGNAGYEITAPSAWDFIALDDSLEQLSKEVDALVFGTLAQRHHRSRTTIEALRRQAKLNVLDVNLRPPFDDSEILELSLLDADIVKLNEDELNELARRFHLPENFYRAVEALAAKFECRAVCVTGGAKGAALWSEGQWAEHSGFKVEVKDTVGSGDAFLAALLSGRLAGKAGNETLAFANAVGAFVATQNGATPLLDLNRIETLLQTPIV